MKQALISVPCELCGAEDSEHLLAGPDRLLGRPGVFHFVRCLSCGLVRQNPRPADLAPYYPNEYPAFAAAVAAQGGRLRSLDHRYGQWQRARLVRQWRQDGRLLDVGCGTGAFLAEMARSGRWEVMGLEPNAYASRRACARGLSVVCGTLADLERPGEPFDVITMWNVLEHLPAPAADLRRAWSLLRPGGYLVVAVPVMEARLRHCFGPYWAEWDLPRHLHVFSYDTVQELFRRTGFKLLAARAALGEYRVLQMSLMSWAAARAQRPAVSRLLRAVVRSFPIRVAGTLLLNALIPVTGRSVAVFTGRRE